MSGLGHSRLNQCVVITHPYFNFNWFSYTAIEAIELISDYIPNNGCSYLSMPLSPIIILVKESQLDVIKYDQQTSIDGFCVKFIYI